MLDHYINIDMGFILNQYPKNSFTDRVSLKKNMYRYNRDSDKLELVNKKFSVLGSLNSFTNIECLSVLINENDPFFASETLAKYYNSHKRKIKYLGRDKKIDCTITELIHSDQHISIKIEFDISNFRHRSNKDILINNEFVIDKNNIASINYEEAFTDNSIDSVIDSISRSIDSIIEYARSLASDKNRRYILYCPKCGSKKCSVGFEDRNNLDGSFMYLDLKKCECGEEFVLIDQHMIDVIDLANQKGYTTMHCCSGHSVDSQMNIVFKNDPGITKNIIGGILKRISILDYFTIESTNKYHGIVIEYSGSRYFAGIGKDVEEISYEEYNSHRLNLIEILYNFIDTLPIIKERLEED